MNSELDTSTLSSASTKQWSTKDSEALYRINQWSNDYFSISEKGEVQAHLGEEGQYSISLHEVVKGAEQRGLRSPLLIRMVDLLYAQIRRINGAFASAISQYNYQGDYRGVYPIKVNQQQQVLEELAEHSSDLNVGLEAGSKAELIAALAHLKGDNQLLICNGYKDEEFINLALHAIQIGIRCVMVVETVKEVNYIIDCSKKLGVQPIIGLRVKLSTRGGGHWTHTGGDSSVFGLNSAQIVTVVDQLRDANMLDCLQLLHYHLGSQIPSIQDIRKSVTEACRIYAGLVAEGANMNTLDIGGGLAIDYDGSSSTASSSRNYSLDEYCKDIIEVVQTITDEANIPHPTLVTEAGRATVAFYSVLIFNILDVSRYQIEELHADQDDSHHELVKGIIDVEDKLAHHEKLTPSEAINDAYYYRDEVRQLFKHGVVSLRERALTEKCFWNILQRVRDQLKGETHLPENCQELSAQLSDIYYGNFSLFQSLPDSWAIDQLFPIMPIHRLDEEPNRQAILSDITCDCDGRIDKFIAEDDTQDSLLLHGIKEGEEYYLGAFIVGAYQETLGDLHNLLGDTNVVSVRANQDGEIRFARELEGDSVSDVLEYVEYHPKTMLAAFRQLVEQAVDQKKITVQERQKIVEAYQEGLRGYTYFES